MRILQGPYLPPNKEDEDFWISESWMVLSEFYANSWHEAPKSPFILLHENDAVKRCQSKKTWYIQLQESSEIVQKGHKNSKGNFVEVKCSPHSNSYKKILDLYRNFDCNRWIDPLQWLWGKIWHTEILDNIHQLIVKEFKRTTPKHSQTKVYTFRNKWSQQDMSDDLPWHINCKSVGTTMVHLCYDCNSKSAWYQVMTLGYSIFFSHDTSQLRCSNYFYPQNDIYNYWEGKWVRLYLAYLLWKNWNM